jgi:adenylate kinase
MLSYAGFRLPRFTAAQLLPVSRFISEMPDNFVPPEPTISAAMTTEHGISMKPFSAGSAYAAPVVAHVQGAAQPISSSCSSASFRLFSEAIDRLIAKHGVEGLTFPREIMWLGGAPGAGKGSQTPFILQSRGIDAAPIVMSDLFDTPEMRAVKDSGRLINDADVITLLLEELLKPEYRQGCIVDGFPRTSVQVDCVRLLYDKMTELRNRFKNTPLADSFRFPLFRVCVLVVNEDISVQRQLYRGRKALELNKKIDAGEVTGERTEVRATDLDEALCRRRYQTFMKETYSALLSLRDVLHFHILDANLDLPLVQAAITSELKYQSQLELMPATSELVSQIPPLHALTRYSRQDLVTRLDAYASHHPETLSRVVDIIRREIVPEVTKAAAVGRVTLTLNDPLFTHSPSTVDMLRDVLVDRGILCAPETCSETIPLRIDLATGSVICTHRSYLRLDCTFEPSAIRR